MMKQKKESSLFSQPSGDKSAQHRTRAEDGTWRDGKASPKLLREDLRVLPGETVTHEWQDGDRIHEEDPDYVAQTILEDRQIAQDKQEAGFSGLDHEGQLADMAKQIDDAPIVEAVPINQKRVDAARFRAIANLTLSAEGLAKKGEPYLHLMEVQHLWFPGDDVNKYELRPGNPPADSERPDHLYAIDLVVDPLHWPRRMVDIAHLNGYEPPTEKDFDEWKTTYELLRATELEEQSSMPNPGEWWK